MNKIKDLQYLIENIVLIMDGYSFENLFNWEALSQEKCFQLIADIIQFQKNISCTFLPFQFSIFIF